MPLCRCRLLGQIALLLAVVASIASAASLKDILSFKGRGETVVIVDMTEEGRKITPPTPEKPTYYFPLVIGYREQGNLVRGEKRPPDVDVVRAISGALKNQNYIASLTEANRPTVMLALQWGYLNPVTTVIPPQDQLPPAEQTAPPRRGGRMTIPPFPPKRENAPPPEIVIRYNLREMLQLVGGNTIENIMPPPQIDDDGNLVLMGDMAKLFETAEDDRYFIRIFAYDFEGYLRNEKKLLWIAKMSMPRIGTNLADAIPDMLKAGEPLFGRETKTPQRVLGPLKEGKVEVGAPKVKK